MDNRIEAGVDVGGTNPGGAVGVMENINRRLPGAGQRVRKRLRDSRGVTIIFALTIFLGVTVMSLVIVGAAMNNIQRVRRQQTEQQDLLAVSSAASYVKELLDGCIVVKTETYADAEGSTAESTTTAISGSPALQKVTGSAEGATTTAFSGELTALITGNDGGSVTWQMTSTAKDTDNKDPLAVDIEIKKVSDYSLVATIKRHQEAGATEEPYTMTLRFGGYEPDVDADTDAAGKTVKTTTYSWKYSDLERDDDDNAE